MTPEQLKLALTDWFDRLDFDRSNEATRHAEYAELLDIIRDIPPDAGGRKPALDTATVGAVEPEELEALICDRSANRAADAILAEFVLTRRALAAKEGA